MQAARITMPSVPCTSKAFQYSNAVSTDVAATFARAREQLAAQAALQAPAPRPPRQRPALMPVHRVRAGTAGHLTLPLF